jgi:hypothetical protein
MKYFYLYNNIEVQSESLNDLVNKLERAQTYSEVRVYENNCKDPTNFIVKKLPNGTLIFRNIRAYNEYRRAKGSS